MKLVNNEFADRVWQKIQERIYNDIESKKLWNTLDDYDKGKIEILCKGNTLSISQYELNPVLLDNAPSAIMSWLDVISFSR